MTTRQAYNPALLEYALEQKRAKRVAHLHSTGKRLGFQLVPLEEVS